MLSKQPILYCCVVHFIFYPLWEDLIELISFSQTPHAPAPGGWCSHQIFSVSRYCAGCLVIVCDGVAYTRWLQPGRARQLAPLSPKTVARCAGVVTQRKWALETPDLGSRVPWSPLVAPSWSVWEHNSSRSSRVHQRHAENSKQTSPPLNEPTWGFAVIIVMNTSFNSGCIIRVCMSSNPLEHEVLNSHT